MWRCTLVITFALTGNAMLSTAQASEPLEALGYFYPKISSSFRNIRPHYDDGLKAVIPADQPVPRNWVVVGHRRTCLQISSTRHMLLVQKLPTRPGAELSIWAEQPIPYGWCVVEKFASPQFPGCTNNMLRIRKM